ncbi:hypothetical protein [Sphingomonas sp. LHG3406-1]|uniref:hypothetical protein n=1 Tax=Sphingomonas sp. LHG3406-1 TaxID=2804617 RepID=UPI0026377569|nr:hypothetical protein [Sphingomonas sp. LHG3406-1]
MRAPPRRDPLLKFGLLAVLVAFVAGVVAILDMRGDLLRWEDARRPPPRALQIDFMPLPASEGPFLTVTEAPPQRARAERGALDAGTRLLPKTAPAVAPELGRRLRMVARLAPPGPPDPDERLMVFDAEERPMVAGRVILRDGCLRIAGGEEPLVVVPAGTRLVRDEAGHVLMVMVQNGRTNARVGEAARWSGGGSARVPKAAAERMRQACGPGRIALPGFVQSESLVRLQSDLVAAENFDEMYGLGLAESLRRVTRCRERTSKPSSVGNPCGSTPPPPVADQSACPAGTLLRGGLCRTARGYVRPVPDL